LCVCLNEQQRNRSGSQPCAPYVFLRLAHTWNRLRNYHRMVFKACSCDVPSVERASVSCVMLAWTSCSMMGTVSIGVPSVRLFGAHAGSELYPQLRSIFVVRPKTSPLSAACLWSVRGGGAEKDSCWRYSTRRQGQYDLGGFFVVKYIHAA
jgi:hypothetical protein